MAGEVRLDLQVGLDTAYLRNQLSTIGTKLGGQSITLPVTFNRQDISTKTKALQRYIGNKTFDIKIESNTLQALTDKVQNFQRRLQELKSEKITLDIAVGGFASIGDREAEKVQRDLRDAVLGGQKKIFIPTSIRPSIPRQHVRDFTNAVKSKLAGITVDVKINPLGAKEAAAQASTPAAATQGGFSQYRLRKLGQDIKPLYQAAARAGLVEFDETIANDVRAIAKSLSQVGKDVVAGLLNGLSSGNPQLQQAARSLGKTLIKTMKTVLGIASPSREFKKIGENVGEGFQIGAVQSLDKAFDALERKLEERLRRLQALTQGGPSRRGAFPFVAKTGPIEGRALASESMRLAAEIDVAYQQLAQVRQQRQTSRESSLAFQRSALGQQAGRLLPAGISPLATTGPTAQEQVVRQFYASLQATEQTLRRYFSANSYLPKATRDLTRAMQVAQASIKMLPSAMTPAIAGLLPAAGQSGALYAAVRKGIERKLDQQMRGLMLPAAGDISSRQFRDAAAKAAQIDAANQARYQARQARIQARQSLIATRSAMSRLALPAAGETGAVAAARTTLSGQQFRAPSLGRTAAGQPGAAMDQSGPIADRLRQAAVNFSKNAPAVIKYLNLFSTAGGINISDLPGPGESPGQYIRRIQQSLRLQLKQGGFGAGTVPSRTEFFQPGGGPQLPGMPLQPRLPPAGGTGGGDRVRGAGQPLERGGELAIYAPATRLDANYFENMRRFNTALDAARASMKNFQGENAPFIGGLRGIASEFGEATKQVLLYGTAYKGLAFITSLPGQIINAAKGQQQFANAMQVATQETGTFGKEMLFVDNVQRTFGLNLESTRTGFTRLFASMAPTGFDSGAIEKLFVGISAAAASLQMTPDKVDRVIYAFGQMASKGQIMSEELKGQLGDVLPGALALFAKAAGMSVKDFSKAMEDGQFVGGRFQEVFAKVSDELINRFSTGAQVASRSIVGLTNKVQGEFTRTLEALAPFANAAIQAVLGPLPTVLREIGTAAQLSSGEIGRLQLQLQQAEEGLKELKATPGIDPAKIQGATQSIAAYKVKIEELNGASKDPAIQQRAKDIKAFTDELTRAGTFVMNLARSLGDILGRIVTALGGNFMTVASTVVSFALAIQGARLAAMALTAALILYRSVTAALGILNLARQLGSFSAALAASGTNAKALAGAMRLLGIQMSAAQVQAIGLRKVLFALGASTFVGLVVGGIALIATALASLGDKAGEAARKTKEAINSIREAARTGQVETIKMDIAASEASQRTLKAARETVEAMATGERSGRSTAQVGTIDAAAIPLATRAALAMEGIEVKSTGRVSQSALVQQIKAAEAAQATKKREGEQQLPLAVQRQKELGTAVPGALPPAGAEELDQKARDRAARDAERAAEDARRMADEKRRYESELLKINAAQAMDLDDAAFDHWKTLQDEKFNYLEAGQNAWMRNEIKLQRDLQQIEIQRIEAIRKARQETQKAEVEANARAMVAQEQAPFGGTAAFGATGRTFNAKGWVHGHFQNMDRAALVQDTTDTVMRLLSQGVPAELGGGQRFTTGMGRDQVEALVRQGIASHKKYASGVGAIDVFVPEGTKVPMPLSGVGNLGGAAGIAGTLPGGTQLMHLAAGSRSSVEGNAARQRKEATKDHNAQLAVVEALNKKELETVRIKLANEAAQQKVNTAIKEYVASVAPVEQQKLENSLLATRIKLMQSGAFGESLDVQMQMAEADAKRALGVQLATAAIADNEAQIKANNEAVKAGTKDITQAKVENEVYARGIATNTQKINELNQATKDYLPTLQEKLRLTQQAAEAELRGAIERATPLGGMGLSAGFIGDAASRYEEAIGRGASREEAQRFGELQNQLTLLETRNNAIKSSIMGIGDAFGTAMTTGVAGLIDGTASAEEVFSNFLKSVGQTLLQAAQQMIATYIAIGIARIFAGLGGGGGEKGLNLTDMKKYSTEGPISAGMFSGFAKGGIAPGGFQAFADGGVVNSPTLGLVGEGRYNEAIVPLPDGRSIPVQMQGNSVRERMNNTTSSPLAPILSMSFESTNINGVEYVSRDQLEAAMAETRRAAARDGAQRGMTMTLDRIQNSPSTRRRIGA